MRSRHLEEDIVIDERFSRQTGDGLADFRRDLDFNSRQAGADRSDSTRLAGSLGGHIEFTRMKIHGETY